MVRKRPQKARDLFLAKASAPSRTPFLFASLGLSTGADHAGASDFRFVPTGDLFETDLSAVTLVLVLEAEMDLLTSCRQLHKQPAHAD
jgi:hypothetical protein